MLRPTLLKVRWQPFSGTGGARADDRLRETIRSWAGTRYASGHSVRGQAADCIGAVLGILDDLDGLERYTAGDIPADTALHDPTTAYRALVRIKRQYSPLLRLRTLTVEPGDLLVFGPSNRAPSHIGIVGPERNTIWHCVAGSGFCRIGWATQQGYPELVAAYRSGLRDNWHNWI